MQKGSHGYALRSLKGPEDDIVGFGPSLAGDKMSSLTTKNHGLIGLLITLHIMLCKKFSLCKEECFDSIWIYIDNKTLN